MGGSSPPEPPDPQETAAAQTSTNIGTAIANAYLQNIARDTPEGSLRYDVYDNYKYTDPSSGNVHEIPLIRAVEQLTPMGQQIRDEQTQAKLGMAQIGNQATQRLGSLLGQSMDLSGLPSYGGAPGTDPQQIAEMKRAQLMRQWGR